MVLTPKKLIEHLVLENAFKQSATYSASSIFYALELIAEKPIGRNKVAEKLNVGKGAVRTLVSRLEAAELVVTTKTGIRITKKGLKIWKQFEEIFPVRVEIPKTDLTNSEYNFAFLIKNSGHKVKSGMEQRDAAMISGAKRTIVILDKAGNMAIESVSDNIKKDFPDASQQILNNISPMDNDVIIIAGASSLLKAKNSALAASWLLLNDDKKTR